METPQTMNTGPAAQFSVGSVLSRSFATLLKNLPVFIGLTVVAILLSAIIGALLPQTSLLARFISQLAGYILAFLMQGAIAFAAYKALKGEKASFGSSVSRAVSCIVPLVLAALIMGIGITIGMILLVIPAIILLCLWAVTIQVCVVEKRGATDSLVRSAELTKGYRMTIFGCFLVVYIAIFLLAMLPAYVALVGMQSPAAFVIFMLIFLTLPTAFNHVMSAVIYYDLRAIKEGVSVDNLEVFD